VDGEDTHSCDERLNVDVEKTGLCRQPHRVVKVDKRWAVNRVRQIPATSVNNDASIVRVVTSNHLHGTH
jgi:hypothetical protein